MLIIDAKTTVTPACDAVGAQYCTCLRAPTMHLHRCGMPGHHEVDGKRYCFRHAKALNDEKTKP